MSLTIITRDDEETIPEAVDRAIQASRDEGGNRVVLRCRAGLALTMAMQLELSGGRLESTFGIYTVSGAETDERPGWCVEIDPSMPMMPSLG